VASLSRNRNMCGRSSSSGIPLDRDIHSSTSRTPRTHRASSLNTRQCPHRRHSARHKFARNGCLAAPVVQVSFRLRCQTWKSQHLTLPVAREAQTCQAHPVPGERHDVELHAVARAQHGRLLDVRKGHQLLNSARPLRLRRTSFMRGTHGTQARGPPTRSQALRNQVGKPSR